jgi:hypothetical protein
VVDGVREGKTALIEGLGKEKGLQFIFDTQDLEQVENT